MDRALLLNVSEWLGVIAVIMLLGVSGRFRRAPLGFRYPAREGRVSLALYALILLLAFLFYRGSVGGAVLALGGAGQVWPRFVLALLSLLPFAAALQVRRQPLRSAGFERASTAAALRAALVLVLLVIILRGQVFSFLRGLDRSSAALLLGWIALSLAEETIFRGYIQPRLSAWLGAAPGIVLTALLFTLWNLPRLWAAADLPLNLGLTLVNALVLGWLMHRTGNILAPGLYRAFSEWLRLLV